MNAVNFEKWFQEQLIQVLPTSTLIVMNNASHHRYSICLISTITCCITLSHHLEEQPKQRWKKAELKQWLNSKGIPGLFLWLMYAFDVTAL